MPDSSVNPDHEAIGAESEIPDLLHFGLITNRTVGADVPWTSGVMYIDSQRGAAESRIAAKNAKERQRLLDLRNNDHLPLVYMDVSIKGEPIGKMVFVLFPDEAPRAAENYRQLFTGEAVSSDRKPRMAGAVLRQEPC